MRSPVLALICVIFLPMLATAADQSAEQLLSFADHLFEQGDYYRAITEYERVLFFHPGHPLAKTARLRIAEAYLRGERYDQAIERFQAIHRELPDDDPGRKAYFLLGEAYYRKRDHSRAADVFEDYIERYPADTRTDAARIRLGWCLLRQGKWQEAAEAYRNVPVSSPLHAQAEGLAAGAQEYPTRPTKSPALAGTLSAVLPGAGQLYDGRPADALVSFLLNGAFIWATVEAFRQDNNVTGGILLFFEAGWYLGNIYNAVGSAHKFNRRSEQQLFDGLETRYGVTAFTDGKGMNGAALSLRF